jgi:hypothetical protein
MCAALLCLLLQNVQEQLVLWESETRRVQAESATLYSNFEDDELFLAASNHAAQLGVRLWADNSQRQFAIKRLGERRQAPCQPPGWPGGCCWWSGKQRVCGCCNVWFAALHSIAAVSLRSVVATPNTAVGSHHVGSAVGRVSWLALFAVFALALT